MVEFSLNLSTPIRGDKNQFGVEEDGWLTGSLAGWLACCLAC